MGARRWGIALGVVLAPACTAPLDDGTGGFSPREHDPLLTRLRLLAVRADPPVPRAGAALTLEALALGGEVDGWRVDGVGFEEELPVTGPPADLLRVPGLVAPVAREVPAEIALPAWRSDGFEVCSDPEAWSERLHVGDPGASPRPPDACTARVLLRVTAVGDGEEDAALVAVPVQIGAWDDLPVAPLSAAPLHLDHPTHAAPDDVVEVALSLALPPDVTSPEAVDVRWYTTAGGIEARGEPAVQEGRLRARAILRTPEAPSGPVGVAAVVAAWRARPVSGERVGVDMTWATGAIAVE